MEIEKAVETLNDKISKDKLLNKINEYFSFILRDEYHNHKTMRFNVYQNDLSFSNVLSCIMLCPTLLYCLEDYSLDYAVAAVYYSRKQTGTKIEVRFEDHVIERELNRYKILGILP